MLGHTSQTSHSTIPHQVFPQEAPNSTNIDEVIKKAGDNDAELTDINLNNIKYISDEKWANLFKSLAENSNVESLSAANCNLTDPICNLLCNCLEVNNTFLRCNLNAIYMRFKEAVK